MNGNEHLLEMYLQFTGNDTLIMDKTLFCLRLQAVPHFS